MSSNANATSGRAVSTAAASSSSTSLPPALPLPRAAGSGCCTTAAGLTGRTLVSRLHVYCSRPGWSAVAPLQYVRDEYVVVMGQARWRGEARNRKKVRRKKASNSVSAHLKLTTSDGWLYGRNARCSRRLRRLPPLAPPEAGQLQPDAWPCKLGRPPRRRQGQVTQRDRQAAAARCVGISDLQHAAAARRGRRRRAPAAAALRAAAASSLVPPAQRRAGQSRSSRRRSSGRSSWDGGQELKAAEARRQADVLQTVVSRLLAADQHARCPRARCWRVPNQTRQHHQLPAL